MTGPESTRNPWSLELNRRTLLRGGVLGGAGLAAAALIGCGGDDDDDDESASTAADTSGNSTSTGATTASQSSTTTQSSSSSSSDSSTASTTSEDTEEQVETLGEWIKDPDLPYPFNYPEPPGTPKPGGVMKVATSWDYQTLDPIASAAGGTVTVPNVVYNRLLGIVRGPAADPYLLELEPELAQSWERSPDGLTFTFNITPGITWQNLPPLSGRAFTAEDARFAIEFNSAWVPSKLPDVSTVAWSTSGFDADNWFHGQIHSQSPGNRWRINDPQLDEWADQQQLELDPDARRDI